MRLSS
jgi:hypothetical protein